MEFLQGIWGSGPKAKPQNLSERKIIYLGKKDILLTAMKEILSKKKLTNTDKRRLDHMRAELDKIERYERWGL